MLLPNLRLSYNNNNKNNNQLKKKRQHELKYFITKMPLCVVKIFLRNSIHGNKLLSKNPNLSKQKELYKKKKKYEEKNRILFCSFCLNTNIFTYF